LLDRTGLFGGWKIMRKLVLHGAKLKCSEGSSPSSLIVSSHCTDQDEQAVATTEDYHPFANVPPFGMCKAPSNPAVAAATAAAQGVLTPQPCVPVLPAPWSPGSSAVAIDGVRVLTADSTCGCTWSGTIEITDPLATADVD
jgi:hypothetical protein